MSPTIRWSFLGCALGLAVAGPNAAQAQTVVTYGHGYQGASVQGYDPVYGGSFVRGDVFGAPLARFPRPTELVPSAWGYGTYGIPTSTGIRPAPVGTPTVYVIDTPPRAQRQVRGPGPRIASFGGRRHSSRIEGGRTRPAMTGRAVPSQHGGAKIVTVGGGRTASR